MEPDKPMDRETALLASTFGIFEVKYKVRANAESEWQERCYTIAHMAGVALTDNEAAAELLALSSRSKNWQKFPTEYTSTADYITSNTQGVVNLLPANDGETNDLLREAVNPKFPLANCPRTMLSGKFSGVVGEGPVGEIHLSSLTRRPSSNTDIHDDDFNNPDKRITETITIAENDEECGSIIYIGLPIDKRPGMHCYDVDKLEGAYFRFPNNRRGYFAAEFGLCNGRENKIYGTSHSSSHSQNVRATSVRYSADTTPIQFADVEITQVGWERRPAGLDAMLANENYMGAKSYLLKPDIK
ncbi:MAG: hypothetical protein GC136_06325 [Alphaproteobacteria bacterium]|nr:hypothetical protein [Alphaproteobacteria bacterium]